MRILVAGASGVIGRRLVPLLVGLGHDVVGTTSTPANCELITAVGATAVVCDILDANATRAVLTSAQADLVLHYVTALPDDPARVPEFLPLTGQLRTEGTRNLLEGAAAAGTRRVIGQSIAWLGDRSPGPVGVLEDLVLAAEGVVLRYGRFYGPDTYDPDTPPEHPRVHIDAAARATVAYLDSSSGTYEIVEPLTAS